MRGVLYNGMRYTVLRADSLSQREGVYFTVRAQVSPLC
jgi:hypothetical protein